MIAPEKHSWMIEDGPKCKDCIHRFGSRGFRECAMSKELVTTQMMRTWTDEQLGFPSCGPDGKLFERKTPKTYDFAMNPPPALAWK